MPGNQSQTRFPYPHYHYYSEYYGPYYNAAHCSDEEIENRVRNALIVDSWVNAGRINVHVKDRVVTLSGTLDSILEKRAAGDDAWDTLCVADVINNMDIKR